MKPLRNIYCVVIWGEGSGDSTAQAVHKEYTVWTVYTVYTHCLGQVHAVRKKSTVNCTTIRQ